MPQIPWNDSSRISARPNIVRIIENMRLKRLWGKKFLFKNLKSHLLHETFVERKRLAAAANYMIKYGIAFLIGNQFLAAAANFFSV